MSQLPERIRRIVAPRKRLPLLEWVKENIWIHEGPRARHGVATRFDVDWFPLQRDILDALDKPGSVVVIVGPPQCGKTLIQIMFIAYWLFEREAKCLYFNAAAPQSQVFWMDKFKPALEASPALKAYLPENRDEQGKAFFRTFTNGQALKLVGSESASPLASSTSPIVVGDDVQDMPPRLGERGHPCDLATKRQASFAKRETATLFCGTAGTTDDYHWQKLQASSYYVPYLPCPGCGAYQWLDFDRMVYDADDPLGASE